jgi:hypothetical protein
MVETGLQIARFLYFFPTNDGPGRSVGVTFRDKVFRGRRFGGWTISLGRSWYWSFHLITLSGGRGSVYVWRISS